MNQVNLPTYEELRRNAKLAENYTVTFTFTAGALIRGAVRRFLNNCIFIEELNIEWIENKSFLVSEFVIKGNATDIMDIEYSLKQRAS